MQVTGSVEKAEELLGVHVVDEPAATAAVSQARGEIAIARLAIRKARMAVDRAEEEERCGAAVSGESNVFTIAYRYSMGDVTPGSSCRYFSGWFALLCLCT